MTVTGSSPFELIFVDRHNVVLFTGSEVMILKENEESGQLEHVERAVVTIQNGSLFTCTYLPPTKDFVREWLSYKHESIPVDDLGNVIVMKILQLESIK